MIACDFLSRRGVEQWPENRPQKKVLKKLKPPAYLDIFPVLVVDEYQKGEGGNPCYGRHNRPEQNQSSCPPVPDQGW